MAKNNLVLATASGPLGGREVLCIYHLNRVCMHGSVGGACPFFHVGNFNQVVQCSLDKRGKKCFRGHSCAYWHGAECNQGLMGKQDGPILPYPPSVEAHTGQQRGFAANSSGATPIGGREVRWIRGREDAFFRFGWAQCMRYYNIELVSSQIGGGYRRTW